MAINDCVLRDDTVSETWLYSQNGNGGAKNYETIGKIIYTRESFIFAGCFFFFFFLFSR